MKLYIKQEVFSWNDKFYIKDERSNDKYYAESELFTWGKKLHVYDMADNEVAFIEQKLFTWLPKYTISVNGIEIAEVVKEFSFLKPYYTINGLNWTIDGSYWEHDYTVYNGSQPIVSIEKEWFTWGDSYVLDITDTRYEVPALAVVLIIDCIIANSRN